MATALILGASRGLGLALAAELRGRGWAVIGTVRREGTGGGEGGGHGEGGGAGIEVERLEMTDPASLAALRRRLQGRSIDLLFVNAAVSNGPAERVAAISDEAFTRVMVTNALSPMRAIDVLQDLVPASGTIAVMSSSLGSVGLNTRGGWEVYRASKASLNTMMRSYAASRGEDARTLLICDPGWVRTDMGGPDARLGIEESIPLLAATVLAQAGRGGLQYLNYKGDTLPW